jgi:hypothetical protein
VIDPPVNWAFAGKLKKIRTASVATTNFIRSPSTLHASEQANGIIQEPGRKLPSN